MTLIILMGVACGLADTQKQLLTKISWTIKKVENISLGQVAPDELNKGTIWDFKSDNTVTLEIKNDFWNQTNNATWTLTGDNLTIVHDKDTTNLKIEQLTDTELTWVMTDKDTLRFYLTAIWTE